MPNTTSFPTPFHQARLPWKTVAPQPLEHMVAMEAYFERCGLEPSLVELVKARASQINGCAFCVDMHTKDARAMGETEQRLYALAVWREAPFFTVRERAALAWTEAVTKIDEGHAPDDVYEELCRYFGEKEIADLTWLIAAINLWNRLAISAREPVGHYRSAKTSSATAVA